jgi:hypothetical protein
VVFITATDGAATGPKRLLAGWAGLGIVAVLSFVVLFLLVALFDSLRTSNQQNNARVPALCFRRPDFK